MKIMSRGPVNEGLQWYLSFPSSALHEDRRCCRVACFLQIECPTRVFLQLQNLWNRCSAEETVCCLCPLTVSLLWCTCSFDHEFAYDLPFFGSTSACPPNLLQYYHCFCQNLLFHQWTFSLLSFGLAFPKLDHEIHPKPRWWVATAATVSQWWSHVL